MKKKAIITGVTGQDGSYLADLLLKKGFKVYGVVRRTSSDPFYRLKYLKIEKNIDFLSTDLSEHQRITSHINLIKPNFFFNLGAQSFVDYSYKSPMYTDLINNTSVLNILETIKNTSKKTKFYQASTSEMYGGYNSRKMTLNENSIFNPFSPYAIAKLSAYHYTKMYRNSYNIFASNGILFNHESPIRGEQFVTKKIIKGLLEIIYGNKKDPLSLGNLYATRDWGHAKDYVNAMYKIINYKIADDFVVATKKNYSVKDFINLTCKNLGIKILWSGEGLKEVGKDSKGRILININKFFFRPLDVNNLFGDPSKAIRKLKWKRKYDINALIKDMILYEKKKYFK
jgi:GDPmannose 4,6-dehydratase